jgi:5-oxoprolinase (ATP-hydrolysing)
MIRQNILITTKDLHSSDKLGDLQFQKVAGIEPLLYDHIIEVNERIDEHGRVSQPLVENEMNNILRLVFQSKNACIFISLKNSSVNPLHEKALLNLILTAGYKTVFASHQIVP